MKDAAHLPSPACGRGKRIGTGKKVLGVLLFPFVLLSTPSPAHATKVQEVTSPGGITAWLVEEHALPLVAVRVAFTGSGTAWDAPGKEGRAGIASAILMEGAGDMDSSAFNAALENNAIRLDFATDEDTLRASLDSLSEHKEQAFSYLGLALTAPRFDDSALDRVRSQTLSILAQQEEDPNYLLRRAWQKLAFGTHPYANPPLGAPDAIRRISKQDLADFAHRYLTRENMLIAVVGDITPDELRRLLDKHLDALPTHYDPDVTVPDVRLPAQAKQEVIAHDIPQTLVMFGENGIRRDDPEFYAAYVMNQIVGGGAGLTSLLGDEIREKHGLAYAVASRLDPMERSAVWEGFFATRNEQVGNALSVLRDTLKRFSAQGPTDKELADAKTYITGSFVLNLGSNGSIADYLISMQLYHLGTDYLDRRNGLIAGVHKQDVATMAKRLTDPEHLLLVAVGKPNLGSGK